MPSDLPIDLRDAIALAATRLAPFGLTTPVVRAWSLATSGVAPWFKCENLQRTGSFKLRGALNKVLALPDAERRAGVVTSSTGNHGLAVAEALRVAGGSGTIVVSEMAAPYKVQRLRDAALRVIVHEGDPMAAELEARAMGMREGLVYISPYNDVEVAAGQGTIGLELSEQIPDLAAVYVAVGGGGLVSGIATALKAARPSTRIVGCWPRNAPAMHENMREGRIFEVHEEPTLSDATAGNLEPGSITLELCRRLIDDTVLVSEEEIACAVRDTAVADHQVIEGAAGVAVAGYRRYVAEHPEHATLPSAIVLCGGNVSAEQLRTLLHG